MEDKRGRYNGDPCPNCGHPRKRGEICWQCHAQIIRRDSAWPDRPTSEMPLLPRPRPSGEHACIISGRGKDHCGHCDTDCVCAGCGHAGMSTVGVKPPYFVLRCPKCGRKGEVHWQRYDSPPETGDYKPGMTV